MILVDRLADSLRPQKIQKVFQFNSSVRLKQLFARKEKEYDQQDTFLAKTLINNITSNLTELIKFLRCLMNTAMSLFSLYEQKSNWKLKNK